MTTSTALWTPSSAERALFRNPPIPDIVRTSGQVPRRGIGSAGRVRPRAAHLSTEDLSRREVPADEARGSAIDDAIRNYRPGSMPEAIWDVIGDTVTGWVSLVDYDSPDSATRALTATAQFVRYCWEGCGLGMDAEDLLNIGVIDEFVWNGLSGVVDSTRATYRADIIRVARAVRPSDESLIGNKQFPRTERVNPPYTAEQERLLRSWAGAQTTRYTVVNANVMLACGLGAGLTTNELLLLQAGHVEVDDAGVLLHVSGSNPRVVPVRMDWESTLADLAQAAWKPGMYLFRPNRQTITRNGTTNFIKNTRAQPFPVSMQRMRTTWIINHLAAGVPIPTVRKAAGIREGTGMRRYLDFLTEPHPDDARRSLRAGRPVAGNRS
ncbi:hypothetical protein ACPCG0_11475 [Propionibacteriaceae bacterium Y1923]